MTKRKCRHCGERKPTESGIIQGLMFFCSKEHLIGYATANARELAQKGRAKLDKAKRDQQKARKQALKTYPQLVKEAEEAARRYVRARDKPKRRPCVSCDTPFNIVEYRQGWKTGGAWDAGHYRSKGAAPQHRLNVLQIHLQCKSCNAGESKNRSKEATVSQRYRVFMVGLLGEGWVSNLESDNEPVKWPREYLERYKAIFNKRALWYEKRHKVQGVER